ncbi:enoyl-[acyl-carrier-protein] reductase [NADH] 2, chloroplastic isoform X2 [Panicum hallii]|uniref:enoyl-[acyl-carrier-protein] reductase [NADH] 2, chloroplastic isoform X2 n=1 Tax=Panicum hallii TaxID=206008 RepID=UPI000DF4CCD6|nr:enoyl-[acyl-carrier-protein] reductase [NADH] 2, chloroplastic isoform X2 [Panicum hallii]
MGASVATGMQMLAVRPCIPACKQVLGSTSALSAFGRALSTRTGFASCSKPTSVGPMTSSNCKRVIVRAMSQRGSQGLPIDLTGKRAFIAGVADDNGYGWAIAKALAAAGAEILVGTWVPALNIFETSLRRGKFDESRKLPDGSLMEIAKVYPLDAVYDTPEDVPEDVMLIVYDVFVVISLSCFMSLLFMLQVKTNKRYAGASNWTVKEVAETVKNDFGSIDILVHSLANGPEVTKPLLETSRRGYLAAISASSYSFVSLLQHFLPIMNPGGASISLTYIASERIIPGYGGGMSSAKAALESDTRVLAYEAGRKGKIRVNTISAGPLGSRAAKAIGFIEKMIEYSYVNAPLQKELLAAEVGNTAAFLVSPLASAVTGSTIYVDNGLNTMGLALDSPTLST